METGAEINGSAVAGSCESTLVTGYVGRVEDLTGVRELGDGGRSVSLAAAGAAALGRNHARSQLPRERRT